MVGVRIPQPWKEELERIAHASGKPVSQILHDLISEYLQKETGSDKPYSFSSSTARKQDEETDTHLITALSLQMAQIINQVQSLKAELPEAIASKLTDSELTKQIFLSQQSDYADQSSAALLLQVQALVEKLECYLLSNQPTVDSPSSIQSQIAIPENKQLPQDVKNLDVLQSLSTKALARRLGVSDTAIRKAQRSKTREEFALWTQQPNPRYGKLPDPDQLMWEYNPNDKRFYPISS